jgi:hypothetical protein
VVSDLNSQRKWQAEIHSLELSKRAKHMGFLSSEETPRVLKESNQKSSMADLSFMNSPRSPNDTFLLMDHIGDKPKRNRNQRYNSINLPKI